MIQILARDLPSDYRSYNFATCSPQCQRRMVLAALKRQYQRTGNGYVLALYQAVSGGMPIDNNVMIIEQILTPLPG